MNPLQNSLWRLTLKGRCSILPLHFWELTKPDPHRGGGVEDAEAKPGRHTEHSGHSILDLPKYRATKVTCPHLSSKQAI